MLLIPVRVGPSAIHGTGVFTTAPVPRGTPVYVFRAGFDQVYSAEAWQALPEPAREYVRYYSYLSWAAGGLVLGGDHARFMNHAIDCNTGLPGGGGGSGTTVALRDLSAGEELTCDYLAFDGDVGWKFGQVAADAPLGVRSVDAAG